MSIRSAGAFQRTLWPARNAAFAMCDVLAAWWPMRIGAFGTFRLLTQSSQFCRCESVPSPLDRT